MIQLYKSYLSCQKGLHPLMFWYIISVSLPSSYPHPTFFFLPVPFPLFHYPKGKNVLKTFMACSLFFFGGGFVGIRKEGLAQLNPKRPP